MKTMLILTLLISSCFASAEVSLIAVGKVELYSNARSYELVIEGSAAEMLYNTLNVDTNQVGQWLNKNSRGIICGQNLNTKKIACSLEVDESGVN